MKIILNRIRLWTGARSKSHETRILRRYSDMRQEVVCSAACVEYSGKIDTVWPLWYEFRNFLRKNPVGKVIVSMIPILRKWITQDYTTILIEIKR